MYFLVLGDKKISVLLICSQARRFGTYNNEKERRSRRLDVYSKFSANDRALQCHPRHSPRAISARATSA